VKLFKKHGGRIIEHESNIDFQEDFIKPAKNYIPKWYRDDTRLPNKAEGFEDRNIKQCVPLLDAFTTGYTVSLPIDLYVTQKQGIAHFEWGKGAPKIMASRDRKAAPTLPTPPGFSREHYVWLVQGAIKLPRGYSALITHPLNRFDLPFYTLSGVIDDEYVFGQGLLPFFFQEDFEGLIKMGTPIFQVIPFKRESWGSKVRRGLVSISDRNIRLANAYFLGWYKHTHWKKKTYN
jgi:hypothetical protein